MQYARKKLARLSGYSPQSLGSFTPVAVEESLHEAALGPAQPAGFWFPISCARVPGFGWETDDVLRAIRKAGHDSIQNAYETNDRKTVWVHVDFGNDMRGARNELLTALKGQGVTLDESVVGKAFREDIPLRDLASQLLHSRAGTRESDIGYRAYLGFVVRGANGGHLLREKNEAVRAGAKEARNDLMHMSAAFKDQPATA